ncbi:hypothetical protein [Actinoplanes sp. OR16]|uniref:hypothetical protein n=1 Tax=Actinoplanes sp. OR16 TaxID=946334 RepID=UPI000FDCD541|nr:hypothetical protein [Actinoplanes sp. OR16]
MIDDESVRRLLDVRYVRWRPTRPALPRPESNPPWYARGRHRRRRDAWSGLGPPAGRIRVRGRHPIRALDAHRRGR